MCKSKLLIITINDSKPQVGEEPLNRDEVVALRAELRSPKIAAGVLGRVRSPEVRARVWTRADGLVACLGRRRFASLGSLKASVELNRRSNQASSPNLKPEPQTSNP